MLNKRRRWLLYIVLSLSVCWMLKPSLAAGDCHGHFINPVTDICWRCFFPLTIGGITVVDGKRPDTPNPAQAVCVCHKGLKLNIGLAVGFWAPAVLIDVTRHPYCMVNLGGLQLPYKKASTGAVANDGSSNQHSFYHVHAIQIPMLSWFPVLASGTCAVKESVGVSYFSELDSTWQDETLNRILYPEITPILDNIVPAQASQLADCLAATTHLPLDRFFWSAGCQGSLYPLEGVVGAHVDSLQASTLLAERAVLKLHRLGLMQDSSKKQLCREHNTYYLPKSRYRYQLLYPKVMHDCYPFGHATVTWASGVVSRQASEDFGYLIWKKRNCCASK